MLPVTAMKTCWKCRGSLRVADAPFCPNCGAPQRQGGGSPEAAAQGTAGAAPPVLTATEGGRQGDGWESRIEQNDTAPPLGLSLLWLLAFPLSPITYPFLLFRADRRLRRHVQAHLASPPLQTPRATQSPEGRTILGRLADSAGRVTSHGVVPLVVSLLLVSIGLFALFGIPAGAPRPISYERAMEAVAEVGRANSYIYFSSRGDYENFWDYYPTWEYDDIRLSTSSNYTRSDKVGGSNYPSYDNWSGTVSSYDHPPYEFVSGDDRDSRYHRVTSAYVYWEDTQPAGVLFWVCAVALYLWYLLFGLIFWVRFARHRQTELLAAAFAVGRPALHDQYLSLIRQRNTLLMWVVVPLALTGLHMIVFPVLSRTMFARHAGWEVRSGIRAAFASRG